MTNEEAIKELREASDSEVRYGDTDNHYDEVMKRIEAFDIAIKALEQQPCEDAISREAVDEYITNLLSGYLYDEERTRLEDLTAYIWELPSIQPTRPTGKWEFVQYDYNPNIGNWHCSECRNIVNNKEGGIPKYEYCPNCGARMTESEDEE